MDDSPPPTVLFKYKPVNGYATQRADGAVVTGTTNGEVFCIFYVERPGLPSLLEQELDASGNWGKVVNFEHEGSVLREIQSGITMSRTTAADLRDRLTRLLDGKPE